MTFSHPPPSFSFIFFPYLLATTTTPIPSQLLAPTSGAVRIAAEGQDPRIVAQIRDMILDYIKRDNVIILAVNAANTDLANSDAIAFSRLVDPRGERTLAVRKRFKQIDYGEVKSSLTRLSPYPFSLCADFSFVRLSPSLDLPCTSPPSSITNSRC